MFWLVQVQHVMYLNNQMYNNWRTANTVQVQHVMYLNASFVKKPLA
jgi:hypothetical protein